MLKFQRFFTLSTFLLVLISISAQIKIKELPSYDLSTIDSLFFEINKTRSLISLRNDWEIFSSDTPDKRVKVSVPSTFTGQQNLTYERMIFLSAEKINKKNLTLNFLGINNTADILLNDLVIYKHPGGTQPFKINLPDDILKPNTDNRLTVNVQFAFDDFNTIPVLQRFLFPNSTGGITGDVYITESNKISINDVKINSSVSTGLSSAVLSIKSYIQNSRKKSNQGTSEISKNYKLIFKLVNPAGTQIVSKDLTGIEKNDITESVTEISIVSPVLWTPENPHSYRLDIELIKNDSLIDRTSRIVSLYKAAVENNLITINENEFEIKATTYFYSENESGGLISYNKLKQDLRLIKETGFNTVRFAKVLPPSYALKICEDLGLFALLEIPINSIPEQILSNEDFSLRVTDYLNLIVEQFSGYSSVLGFGLGGGYIGESQIQIDFLKRQAKLLEDKTDRIIYASFVNLPYEKIEPIDLFGVELFSASELRLAQLSNTLQNFGGAVFISEASYPSFKGNSNGYLNNNSYEAAAKYFSDIIDFSEKNKLNGFVINSFFDFKGPFKSFYAGYNEENKYVIGLLPDNETTDRISYKVVKSKLTNADKITIPIGTASDDSPILFVIIGLVLSVFMALLINSKRKFREDATRALIRPYNFFADIRDHRLLSGIQTNLLMFILAGSLALLVINILYYLRTNILLEKILLSFGSAGFIDFVNYLSWHPLNGFLILFGISVLTIFLLSILIKLFSFLLKNKVYFSSIYYSVIWALLPASLLLPLELVLYRVLSADMINLYLYIFVVVYLLWLGQRMLKGIHVIFDVRPFKVHFYGWIVILFTLGGMLLYFHLANSTVYHIIRAVTEYKFL